MILKKNIYIYYINLDQGENEINWLKKMILPLYIVIFTKCRIRRVFEFFE